MNAPPPADEGDRLLALHRYAILDTAAEQVFDDVTLLAAHICITPIAQIDFVDAGRVWFKSRTGWNVSELARDVSFSAHAILEPTGLFSVRDTAQDDRFARNPLVAGDPGIRFYEAAVLFSPEGHALGTLSVLDRVPRKLRPEQELALQALARQVMALLELRRNTDELKKAFQERHEAEEMFRTLFESAPDAVLLVDPTGTIVRVNQRAEDLFGYPRDQLTGQVVEILMPEHFRERHQADRAGYFANPHTRPMGAGLELQGRRRDGTEFPVDIMLSLLQTRTGTMAMAVVRDDGDRRRASQELESARKKAEEARRGRLHFLATMSRELTGPLDVLQGYGQVLQEKARDLDRPDLLRDLENMRAAVGQIFSLITEMREAATPETASVKADNDPGGDR